MRIDQDLVRLILLETEGEELVDLSPYSQEQIRYHSAQLIEAGYLKGFAQTALNGEILVADVSDVAWTGHEFLANARNDTFWNRTKSEVAKLGGSVSVALLAEILKQVSFKQFGI